jgi:hypothetical protein
MSSINKSSIREWLVTPAFLPLHYVGRQPDDSSVVVHLGEFPLAGEQVFRPAQSPHAIVA